MSWRSDSISDVTVWNGAVVASAAASPTSPVRGDRHRDAEPGQARPRGRTTCSRSG